MENYKETDSSLDGEEEKVHLDLSPLEMNAFFKERQVYLAAIKEVRTRLEILDESFHFRYAYNPIHHIESRLKSIPSTLRKLDRLGHPPSAENMKAFLQDVAGIRVICNYLDDVDRIADMLLSQDDVRLIKRKDYHKNPKPNGYRSLHLVVSVPVYLADERREVTAEIQIRTIAMDLWASLEHQLRYKNPGSPVDVDLSARLFSCAEILNRVDDEMQGIYNQILVMPRDEDET